jgi:hypothetical protein
METDALILDTDCCCLNHVLDVANDDTHTDALFHDRLYAHSRSFRFSVQCISTAPFPLTRQKAFTVPTH